MTEDERVAVRKHHREQLGPFMVPWFVQIWTWLMLDYPSASA